MISKIKIKKVKIFQIQVSFSHVKSLMFIMVKNRKIEILFKNRYFIQESNFSQKSKFYSKIEIMVKIAILFKNLYFIQQSKFYSKIEIVFKNRNF